MFVLPPPPRYPTSQLVGGPGTVALIETHNTLTKPEGPEYQIVVGEGTYVLRDDLHLATPPPHPSEAPVHNPNPLATSISPPTAGVKVSLTRFAPPSSSLTRLYRPNTAGSGPSPFPSSIQEHPNESQSQASDAASYTKSNGYGLGYGYGRSPAFGDGNPALVPAVGKDSKNQSKQRKPKSNIVKSNSSFVSRVIPHESLTKRLAERNADGMIALVNINRAIQWLDLSSPTKDEHLTKILFTKAHALCHDINPVTTNSTHIDFIMGFSTADMIWYDPMSQKYARLNKNGTINNSAVSDIKWLPHSENLFLAAHMDGSLVVYDKEKEDAPFVPEDPVKLSMEHTTNGTDKAPTLAVQKSVQSRNQKVNPVAYWKVSHSKINGFAFSPDARHLAVVCEDGSLRVLDYLKEELLDIYSSYYGGMICVCWSPDGRYIVTGGQDDLISIWSLEERAIVARCQGHNSWVMAVQFDPWRCDERNYRFGSVGEDCRLLLWDFSVGMLHRPRATSVRHGSVSSPVPGALRHRSDSTFTTASVNGEEIVHPVEPRARTAMLPPVAAKSLDDHPLCWLSFQEDCIMTASKDGHIRTWDRPKDAGEESASQSSTGNH